MKSVYLRAGAALLLSFVALPGGLLAQQDTGGDHAPANASASGGEHPPAPAPGGEHEHSAIGKQMDAMNRDLRKLSRQYTDPTQKASSLEIVASLQKSADATKALVPDKAEKMPEADKAKYVELYNKDMDALVKEFAALKTDVEAGDNDKVKADLEGLNRLKMSSHKELGVKQGGGPGGRRGGGPSGPPRGETGAPPTQDRAPGAAAEPSPAASSPAAAPSPAVVSPAPVQPAAAPSPAVVSPAPVQP